LTGAETARQSPASNSLELNNAMSDWTGWIETCLEAALIAAAFIAVFEGARRLSRDKFARVPALMLAIGLLVPVAEGSASLKYSANVRALTREMPSMNAVEPAGGWEKAPMTPEVRTARSTNAAQINYLLTGKRGQLIDASGQRVSFVPSDQDLQDREGLVRGQRGAEDASQQFLERGVRLLASATFYMLFGWLVGLFQRRRLALGL
jgi:hypothetical protein